MKLNDRLKAVAKYVDGEALVDVGCDHAYLPIYLIKANKIKKALAVDIVKGPLKIASKNIINNHLEDKIELRLSKGLTKVKSYELDNVTICGMGGILAGNILSEDIEKTLLCNKIIVQPQSEVVEFLDTIKKIGLKVVDEDFIKDREKYYPIFVLQKGSDKEYRYGDYLLKNKVYYEYIKKRESKYKGIYDVIKNSANSKVVLEKYMYYQNEIKRWENVNKGSN